jgi:hypothetical protein
MDTFPLGSMAPCVVRTFLFPVAWKAIERLAYVLRTMFVLGAKIVKAADTVKLRDNANNY